MSVIQLLIIKRTTKLVSSTDISLFIHVCSKHRNITNNISVGMYHIPWEKHAFLKCCSKIKPKKDRDSGQGGIFQQQKFQTWRKRKKEKCVRMKLFSLQIKTRWMRQHVQTSDEDTLSETYSMYERDMKTRWVRLHVQARDEDTLSDS